MAPTPSAPPARERPSANNGRGIALLTFAGLIFTIEVSLVRTVGNRATPEHLMFCRAFAQLVLVSAWFAWTGRWSALKSRRISLHLSRGFASIASWWFYYVSFLTLDLALATTLTFTTQLFVVALAGPILGERVGWGRAGLALLGFVGVVITTRIWGATFNPSVLYGLASAICGAAIVLINRTLTRTETTDTIMFYIGLVTSLAAAVLLILNPQPIALPDLATVALAGSLGAVGMGVMVEAYRVGEVSALAPAPYLRLVFAIAFGFALFGEIPPWTTLVGGAIIIVAALAASRRA